MYVWNSFISLTRFKASHILPNLHDNPGALMAQSIVARHHHVADTAMFPEVDIGATDSSCADVHQALVGFELGDPRFHQTKVVGWACMNGIIVRFSLEQIHVGKC